MGAQEEWERSRVSMGAFMLGWTGKIRGVWWEAAAARHGRADMLQTLEGGP